MNESIPTIISVLFLMIFSILGSILGYVTEHWIQFLVAVILIMVINNLNSRIIALEHEIKKNRSEFEINNIMDARFNKLEEKINHAMDTRYDCSLTTIYNEDETLGHEWMYKIEDGHWATAIYNQKTEKFIVKHFRTDENLKVNDFGKRYFDDTEHNRENVYGNKNAKGNISGMEKNNGIYMPKNKLPTSSPDS